MAGSRREELVASAGDEALAAWLGEVLATVPADVRTITELRNRGGGLDWATHWLRMTPQRLFSFAELAWQGVPPSS
jgi:hypothetical protein